MKRVGFVVATVLILALTAACGRSTAETKTTRTNPACLVATTADVSGLPDLSRLQQDLRERRSPARASERLGYGFVAHARMSNDPGYYKLAEQAAVCLESMQPGAPAALLLRGHALHQMHRFAEAEAVARHLVTVREFVLDYGLLGDALMEQGKLSEAGEAYQRMIDLKPFYQSYTRAAHLRWLKGDLAGAIALMRTAVKVASPRDRESVAWAYARLATYELQRADLSEAERSIDAALQYLPNYAPALLARGRVLLARGKALEATESLQRAADLNSQPEYRWVLADALRLLNRTADAAAVETQLVEEGASDDPRTLALYLATRRELAATATDLARRELESRQDVYSLDALAWALAATGQMQEAATVMDRALAEGTQDARLFVHAAAIAAASGRTADARRWARKAWGLRLTLFPSELDVLRSIANLPSPA